jgi:hypothetical protein
MSGNPATTTEEIVANADYHSRLLQSCSQVEYAPPALKQHDSYIKDLEGQLTESDKKVEDLAKVTKKERKEHEKLRDSTARRFAAKLSGKLEKFEANQMKEEKWVPLRGLNYRVCLLRVLFLGSMSTLSRTRWLRGIRML